MQTQDPPHQHNLPKLAATVAEMSTQTRKTIIVEHLDPELEAWQTLEYKCIAAECAASNMDFLLSGLTSATGIAKQLSLPSQNLSEQSVENLYQGEKRSRVCLLDPKGEKDLAPEDGELFDVFLFGGILGDDPPRGKIFRRRLTVFSLSLSRQDRRSAEAWVCRQEAW